eukprot:921789-Rhodomonas_salina.1
MLPAPLPQPPHLHLPLLDAPQHPVRPELQALTRGSFRDLSEPIGLQTPAKIAVRDQHLRDTQHPSFQPPTHGNVDPSL